MIGVIYCIEHIATKRRYIGSAVDWLRRRQQHLSDLAHNKHKNRYLQNCWNKYGRSAFRIHVIESGWVKSQLLKREQYWINHTKKRFNHCNNARSRLGYKCPPETLARMRKAQNSPQRLAIQRSPKMLAHLARIGREAAINARGKKRPSYIGAKISKSRGHKPGGVRKGDKRPEFAAKMRIIMKGRKCPWTAQRWREYRRLRGLPENITTRGKLFSPPEPKKD